MSSGGTYRLKNHWCGSCKWEKKVHLLVNQASTTFVSLFIKKNLTWYVIEDFLVFRSTGSKPNSRVMTVTLLFVTISVTITYLYMYILLIL